jgi:hypothetical protein
MVCGGTFLLVMWIVLVCDSVGAAAAQMSGAAQLWYCRVFPSLASALPIDNYWPWVYCALALFGLLSTTILLRCGKRDAGQAQ